MPTLDKIGRTVSRFLFYLVIYLRNLPPGKDEPSFRPYGHSGIHGLAGLGAVTAICRHITS